MAKIRLSKGVVTGTPTEGKDALTVATDSFIYTVLLLGGDDTANLGVNGGAHYTIFTGAGNDSVTGGRGVFYDGKGNDAYSILGNALFYAGSGNDTYNGGEANDRLGFDRDTLSFLYAPDSASILNTEGVTVDLSKKTAQTLGSYGKDKILNIEDLRGGAGNDKFNGDTDENEFYGDAGNDSLAGKAGADTLYGQVGSDKLYGGTGNDSLIGGEGKDFYRGGSGGDMHNLSDLLDERDVVSYSSVSDSKLYDVRGSYWDSIFNFSKGGGVAGDLISFEGIDTSKAAGDQDFVFRGSKKFTADAQWQIRLKVLPISGSSGNTLIQVDTDSDTKAEMEILVAGVTGLGAIDFDL